MSQYLFPFLNISILGLILYFSLKEKVKDGVRSRHEHFSKMVESAVRQLNEGRDLLENARNKLDSVDVEIESLQSQIQTEREQVSARIISEAKKLSGSVVSDARTRGEALINEMVSDVTRALALDVIRGAEDEIKEKLTHDQRTRIRGEFSSFVQGVRS